MTSIADALVAVMNADTALITVLPGKAYTWDSAGRNGISEQSVPNAYVSGLLIPMVIVDLRSENPRPGANDSGAQWRNLRSMMEVYLYNDSAEAYSSLETPMLRILKLLDDRPVVGAGMVKFVTRYEGRDPNLNNAIFIRLDFEVTHGRQLT